MTQRIEYELATAPYDPAENKCFSMRLKDANILCIACRQRFVRQLLIDSPEELFTRALREIRCPRCNKGGNRLALILEEEA